jgi:5-deoxy-5-amino-3-dehydroquinate synthase
LISVPIDLSSGCYEVSIGAGVRRRLCEVLPPQSRKVAVVTQEGIGVDVDPGVPAQRFVLPQGESAKSLAAVENLCRALARAGLSRSDTIVAVGGGVVTDVAGFTAAVYLRGISYVNVPTTLLAQVDAAVGGKTGVNIVEGKNLVGAFWQPVAVLCDTDTLTTLPEREWTSGRGEIAKCAFLGGLLSGTAIGAVDPAAGAVRGPAAGAVRGPAGGTASAETAMAELSLPEQIARCVSIKAAAVRADEREGAERALLNYGHTLAHALEASLMSEGRGECIRHGEAVAVGLVFAARLARRLGRIDDARVALHYEVLDAFGLPEQLPDRTSAAELVRFMSRDKKARQDLTFVLDGPRGVEVVRRVDPDDVVATLAEMGCEP